VFTFGSIIALMLVTAYVTVEVCTHLPFRGALPLAAPMVRLTVCACEARWQLGAVRLNE
jgi:hypothetical protein